MNKIENIIAITILGVFIAIGSFLTHDNPQKNVDNRLNKLEVHFLNVGQGDSILFEKGEIQTLIDGGPDRKVLSELSKTMPVGDKTIENVILTHPHADHLRGLNYVLEGYRVNKVYFNGVRNNTPEFEKFWSLLISKNVTTEILYRGQNIQVEELRLKTLWPPKGLPEVSDINNSSLIMLANYQSSNILLTGDSSAATQERLLKDLPTIDIYKVSHHGSKTAISKTIIDYLKPRYAVISVGRNSYGHPTPTALYLLRPSRLLRTDQSGTISFWFDKTGVFLY